MLKDIIYVGVGGGIGSIFRYLTSRAMGHFLDEDYLLFGTFTVNIIGCFLFGLIFGWLLSHQVENQSYRFLLIIGFCGGYTTFSTFAYENFRLIDTQQWGLFALYAILSVGLGIAAVWMGIKITQ